MFVFETDDETDVVLDGVFDVVIVLDGLFDGLVDSVIDFEIEFVCEIEFENGENVIAMRFDIEGDCGSISWHANGYAWSERGLSGFWILD